MKASAKFALLILACIGVVVLGMFVGDKYTMTLPAPYPLGAMGLLLAAFFYSFTEVCRARTECIIHNHGHHSIREKDIERIPWQEQGEWDEKRDEKITGTITMAFVNGIDYYGFSIPGGKNDPVLVSRSRYFGKERHDHHCYGNLKPTRHNELPLFIQDYLIRSHPNRYDPKKTPVLWGMTSHMDGTATSRNLDIERMNKRMNAEITALRDENADLIEDLERYRRAKEKPTYILGKPIKPIGEGE